MAGNVYIYLTPTPASLSLPASFSDWWHSLSRLCENPRTGWKACTTKNLFNQPLPDLWVMLS